MDIELALLSARLESLEVDNKNLQAAFVSERAQNQRERRRLRCQAGLAFVAFLGAVFLFPANRQTIAHAQGAVFPGIFARLNALEAKTQFQSVDPVAKATTFSGCNLIVNDGSGHTETIVQNAAGQGLGNLIIGYNETGSSLSNGDIRTGSHNLIVGQRNSYSSFGGMVVGDNNAIAGPNASVSGGEFNSASGQFSSVSGGEGNIATNLWASVSGGEGNTASGQSASVSGGAANKASNQFSAVSGGFLNQANGRFSSVSGGQTSQANGGASSVSGGRTNQANGDDSSVSGGINVVQNDFLGWAAGGRLAGAFHNP